MNIDERLHALTVSLQRLGGDIEKLKAASHRDGEMIGALLRVAERRLASVENRG